MKRLLDFSFYFSFEPPGHAAFERSGSLAEEANQYIYLLFLIAQLDANKC